MVMEEKRSRLAGKLRSLREWRPIPFPAGNERLSEQIDDVVYCRPSGREDSSAEDRPGAGTREPS